MSTRLSRSSVVVNDEALNYGDKITRLLCKTDLSFTITFFGSRVLLSFHQYHGGEREPDGPFVIISLVQLGNWTRSNPDRYRKIELEQVCIGRNVSFKCSEGDRGFHLEWKGDVVGIEYGNGCRQVE